MIARNYLQRTILAVILAGGLRPAAAQDLREIFWDGFDSGSPHVWTYAGVSNAASQPLFAIDASSNVVSAEWDQSNLYAFADPIQVKASSLSAPLPRRVTDRDSFCARAKLRLTPGSIPNTTEFYQLASFGLYDVAQMGDDRPLNDDFSGNTTLVRNGSDFVEFSYFINNSFGGPSVTATVGGHVDDDASFLYTSGSRTDTNFPGDGRVGEGHWLPTGTDLYVEIYYFGAETSATGRRARARVYTDAGWTNLLHVNGVPLEYWTQAMPTGQTFSAGEVAFYTYGAANWGGANGVGRGTWDDVAVLLREPLPQPCRGLQRVLADRFEGDVSARWTFSGVSNAVGHALAGFDATRQVARCEWDQSNVYANPFGDPQVMTSSVFYASLGRRLTDRETFCVNGTLHIEPGSVTDTTEFYQLASFGLYDVSQMGHDRALNDDLSGNTTLIRNGSDFVEFSYFINNSFGGPSVTATLGGHVDDNTSFLYTSGSRTDTNFPGDGRMGEGDWLPEGTNLYVALAYYGAATDGMARRAYASVYTDPGRTNLLHVNGFPMEYWTQPMPTGQQFNVHQIGFYNYGAANWGGANGAARGTWDDVFVDLEALRLPPPELTSAGAILKWAGPTGMSYRVDFMLSGTGTWSNLASFVSASHTNCFTNPPPHENGFYRLRY